MRRTWSWSSAASRTVVALVLFAHGIHPAAQTTFSSRVEAVRVDVLVTDRGHPITDLTASSFEVLDNGVPQQVDFASFEQIPLNVVLVLDMSTSVAGERLKNLRSAARAMLNDLRPDDQAALVTFSHLVVQGSDLTSDLDRIRSALDRTLEPGSTALVDGIYTGMTLAEAGVGRSLLIVFSDGTDTASWLTPDSVLDTARRTDVVVYTVRAGGSPRIPFLRDLSELTGGALMDADPNKSFGAIFQSILDEFRHRYLLSYTPQGVPGAGWHRLEVRVRASRAAVKARPGYLRDKGGSEEVRK